MVAAALGLSLAAAAPAQAIIGGQPVPRAKLHFLGAVTGPGFENVGPGLPRVVSGPGVLRDPKHPFPGCSAVLIAARTLMTARHCLQAGGPGSATSISLLSSVGIGNYQGSLFAPFDFTSSYLGKPGAPSGTIIYAGQTPPWVGPTRLDPDVATVTLQTKIRNISPVALPASLGEETALTAPGTPVLAAGYGLVHAGGGRYTFAHRLKEAAMRIVACPPAPGVTSTLDLCTRQAHHRELGHVAPGSVCGGDSGSPLLSYSRRRRRFVAVGVLSAGLQANALTCSPGALTYYTNVGKQLGFLHGVLATPPPPSAPIAGPFFPPLKLKLRLSRFRSPLATRRILYAVRGPAPHGATLAIRSNQLADINGIALIYSHALCRTKSRRYGVQRGLCVDDYATLHVHLRSPTTRLRLTGYDCRGHRLPPGAYTIDLPPILPFNGYLSEGVAHQFNFTIPGRGPARRQLGPCLVPGVPQA